ncbi:MAG: hypothetical protein ABIJ09_20240 [Pseudomonadota bacterium]
MTMRGCFGALVAGAVLASPLRAADVKQIVVLPFSVAEGIHEKTGTLLDEVVLTELDTVVPETIKVVGSSDVTALLGYEQKKMLVGCEETGCLVEIGNALGATHILVPGVGKLGSRYLISAKFLDVKTTEVLLRKVFYVDANEDALLKGVRQISQALAESQGWKTKGTGSGTTPVAGATTPGTPVPATPDKSASAGGEDSTMMWAGVGTAAVGVLMTVGFGIGAVVVDQTVVGNAAGDPNERTGAAGTAMLLGAGSGVGALALIAGAALIGVSLF